ncbi:MAG: glycosyltransferase family 4 protein [Candidatus Magasanikbacteria bacterium]|nr:glycosyltransferase family 4 protein [Candidatus Magasanikbacteria bacterium]
MNIGIDIRCLMAPWRTGVAEYTAEFINALLAVPAPHRYFLFLNNAVDVSKYLPAWSDSRLELIYWRWPNKILNTAWKFVCHPCLPSALDYFFSPNLHFLALAPRTKHILTIHDLSFEHFSDCFSVRQRQWHALVNPRRQCQRAHLVLTPSEHTRADVIGSYALPPDRVRCLSPGLAARFTFANAAVSRPEAVRVKYRLPDKFLLFLGTIEPRKNILGLLRAFAGSELAARRGYELIIAGKLGWKTPSIMAAIRATPRVRYIGYVDETDKPGLYANASVFVYPSLYEGFGFPVLEAMASSVPVITSNRSSLPEVVGEAGYLVDPMNIYEIRLGLERLLSDMDLRNLLIERGRVRAKVFSWSRFANQWLTCLSD